MSTLVAKSGGIGVLVMHHVISEHKDNLKGSSINKVLCMWLSHYSQFGNFVTKRRDKDQNTLQIVDPKVIQGKIDAVPWEKDLQATAEKKVALGQLAIGQFPIAEAN